MLDLTNEMRAYKEAVRHLWNTVFMLDKTRASFDDVDAWRTIDRAIFRQIVKTRVSNHASISASKDQSISLLVLPAPMLDVMPAMIKRAGGSWSTQKPISINEFGHPVFLEFFDWDPCTFRDLALIRCRSELNDCEYLVEQFNCRFGLEETGRWADQGV